MKLIKRLIVIALILLLVGAVISFAAFAAAGFDVNELDGQHYTGKTQTVTEDVSKIKIASDSFDIKAVTTNETDIKVVAFDGEDVKTNVKVTGDVLEINVTDSRSWYEKFLGGIGRDREITVYLPAAGAYSVEIVAKSADVDVSYTGALSSASVKTASGDVEIRALRTDGTLSIETSSGDVSIENSYAKSSAVTTSSGDVEFESFDTDGISIQTKSGDVEGEFVGSMNYNVSTKSGRVRTPASDSAGAVCSIKTSSGDVEIGYDD